MGWPSKSHPQKMSEAPLVQAFNLTVSVKEDISDECVKAVVKWIKKNALHAFVVLEQETSKRHLHAALFFKDPRSSKKLRENIWDRQVKPHHPTSIGRVAVHLQASPGRKWLDEYLLKEDSRDLLLDTLPDEKDELTPFFPSAETQAALMAAKDKVVDVFYATHEVVYKEWLHENVWVSSTETAHEYFLMRMFERKDIRVCADSRRVHQMAVALHRYATGSRKLTNLEISTHVKENCAQDYSRP